MIAPRQIREVQARCPKGDMSDLLAISWHSYSNGPRAEGAVDSYLPTILYSGRHVCYAALSFIIISAIQRIIYSQLSKSIMNSCRCIRRTFCSITTVWLSHPELNRIVLCLYRVILISTHVQ